MPIYSKRAICDVIHTKNDGNIQNALFLPLETIFSKFFSQKVLKRIQMILHRKIIKIFFIDEWACDAHVDGRDWPHDPLLAKQICYPLHQPGVGGF